MCIHDNKLKDSCGWNWIVILTVLRILGMFYTNNNDLHW